MQTMKLPELNIFLAWFLIPQTLAMGWVAAAGRLVLELFGIVTEEQAIPGRIVGALLLLPFGASALRILRRKS